jgi:cobalt/nickel transport system ATP-binding protein
MRASGGAEVCIGDILLTVTDIVIDYEDGTRAVDGVRFSIAPGENAALLGANGAGKTSLLLALVGILKLVSGNIQVGDILLNKKTTRMVRSRVGLVFQNPDDQLFMANIWEDVAFGPRNFGCGEAETAERVQDALTRLGIGHLAARSPLKLSGGEKRLAAIATVLAMEPEFLLFDEPTAYLDPRAKRNLAAILAVLPQGKLIATHDLAFAEAFCTRGLLLRKGSLAADRDTGLFKDADALEAAGL